MKGDSSSQSQGLRMTKLIEWVAVLVVVSIWMAAGWSLMAAIPWHPPGEDEPTQIECRSYPVVDTLYFCEAKHLKYKWLPNAWPKWEAWHKGGYLADRDRGIVAYLDLTSPDEYLIILKQAPDPRTWVETRISTKGRK